jgi:hypothetical protein
VDLPLPPERILGPKVNTFALVLFPSAKIKFHDRIVNFGNSLQHDDGFEKSDACIVVRDHNGQALAYVYFEDEPGRRSAAKLLTKDEAPALSASSSTRPRSYSVRSI